MYTAAASLALAAILPSALAATYDVQVGPGGRFVYEPPEVHAVTGDIINFIFNPKNHTVTQSAFDPPCVPLADGFRTGFVPVAPGSEVQTRQFTVPDNGGAPIWFYCGQGTHCGQGMVFAINAPASPSERSFEAHRNLAIARNGTGASSAPAPSATWTPPPPQPWYTATATVTWGGSSYTTTYTSYEGSPDPTPGTEPREHIVIVGADNQLTYSPPNTPARVGDTVTFEFQTKNHTVTQSSFANPCQALVKEDGTSGFRSGFRPVPAGATSDFPRFSVRINDTAPIWGYCGQTGHCGAGMVFAINAVESGPNNFAAFRESARQSASNGAGGSGGSGGQGGQGGSGSPSTSGGAPSESDPAGALAVSPRTSLAGLVALTIAGFVAAF